MYGIGVFLRRMAVGGLIFAMMLSAFLPLSATELAALSANSAALYCADIDKFIFEKNADTRRGMASTTKIMTALVAIEADNTDVAFTIPPEAVGIEGSSLYLQAGECLTIRDLLYGLLLQSANDAAVAIALALDGNVADFVARMNEKADAMGLENTHFTNPHGLAEDEHYTTARELALIAAEAMQLPLFREICGTRRATIPGSAGSKRVLVNHNKLLFSYADAIGIKTGYTKATGRCLVSAATRDGVTLIAVTLSASDDWHDHTAMLDHGFAQYECIALADAGQCLGLLPLLGGDESAVEVCTTQAVTAVLPRAHGSIIERIELNRPRFAPIYAADRVGRVVWLADGKEIASTPLVARRYIGRSER